MKNAGRRSHSTKPQYVWHHRQLGELGKKWSVARRTLYVLAFATVPLLSGNAAFLDFLDGISIKLGNGSFGAEDPNVSNFVMAGVHFVNEVLTSIGANGSDLFVFWVYVLLGSFPSLIALVSLTEQSTVQEQHCT